MALCSVVATLEDPLHGPGPGHVRVVLHTAILPESASGQMHATVPGLSHMLPQMASKGRGAQIASR